MERVEHTGRVAVADENGNSLFLDEYTTFRRFVPVNDPVEEWLPGAKRYELDGEHCNVIGDGVFETLNTGKVLRKITDVK